MLKAELIKENEDLKERIIALENKNLKMRSYNQKLLNRLDKKGRKEYSDVNKYSPKGGYTT